MPAGDQIVADYQYEFNGLLWGAKTKIRANKVTGLLGAPPVRTRDSERQDAWGDFPGIDLYGPRSVAQDLFLVDNAPGLETEQLIDQIVEAFTINSDAVVVNQFVFQRPDGRGKRFAWARPRRADFDGMYETSIGLCVGSIELKAHDPRYYSLAVTTDPVTIPNTLTNVAVNVTNNGKVDAAPTLEINGPCTNPRISNLADGNKAIKLQGVIPAGQTLVVDVRARTVTLNGADVYRQMIKPDNRWWRLKPGVNQISYNRDDAGGPSTVNVKHRDAWIS